MGRACSETKADCHPLGCHDCCPAKSYLGGSLDERDRTLLNRELIAKRIWGRDNVAGGLPKRAVGAIRNPANSDPSQSRMAEGREQSREPVGHAGRPEKQNASPSGRAWTTPGDGSFLEAMP